MSKYDYIERDISATLFVRDLFDLLLKNYSKQCLSDIKKGCFDDLKALKWQGLKSIADETYDLSLKEIAWLMLLYGLELEKVSLVFKDKNLHISDTGDKGKNYTIDFHKLMTQTDTCYFLK